MTSPVKTYPLHALFDGSDHGLIPGSALDRARNGLSAIDKALQYAVGSDFDGAEQEYDDLKAARKAFTALLAEHEALLAQIDDAPTARMGEQGVLYGQISPLEELSGQFVRILAEPGEVGS